ncbi:MAG: hypothetical protein AUI14_19160 [Actinobacteria bacterium 13_2_20CM_2_71_6]|nr:MAG: hypothetical protein AUI14_19160 [Actinobacteria bacterium 13_2_20CM_2_71_6]
MATDNGRNAYVDWLRAFSLLVVILWHWAFTLITWNPANGPHANSPLGFTKGFWILTWLLQVMPLFFYIGGFVHLRSWERAQARGERLAHFVGTRLRQLAVPAALLVLTWAALGAGLGRYFDLNGETIRRTVKLIVSPLWFLAVYLMLIALLPIALWLHRRFGILVVIWLGGLAMTTDVLRFHYHLDPLAWLNMVFVWALAHQAGFFYRQVVDAPRQVDWTLLWAGLFGLVGMVFSGLYPGSMVGVPGDRFSNVAPPTFVIVCLLVFQVGVVEVLRPTMERLLVRPRWALVNSTINRFALPLFLFHSTGMALSRFITWRLGLQSADKPPPDLTWWLLRPVAVLGPLVCTLPVIFLFGRRWIRAAPPRAGPPPVAGPPVPRAAPGVEAAPAVEVAPETAVPDRPGLHSS